MNSQESEKTYQYTHYNSQNKQGGKVPKPIVEPLSERDKNMSRSGHFTTIHTQNHQNSSYSHPNETFKEPIVQEKPHTYDNGNYNDHFINSNPLTFPYKNPGCSLSISGKSGFQIKGEHVNIKIEKVLNSRNGGKSGTLRLELIRMPYFYDGGEGIKPEEYTSVCTAHLGQLDGGWSFNDIVRGGMKRVDETDQYSYRKCYVLLLEEYSEGRFKIVDYMNFD